MHQLWTQKDKVSDEVLTKSKKSKKKKKEISKVLPDYNIVVSNAQESDNVYLKTRQKRPKSTIRLSDKSNRINENVTIVAKLLFGKQSRLLGVPYLLFGLLLSVIIELYPHTQRYNIVVILVLAVSAEFRLFPKRSVRPQIIISVITFLSISLDIFYLVTSRYRLTPTLNTLISLVMIGKCILLYAFLRNVNGSVRTRKYLNRRIRLFYIPFYQPRRIMRDVRGRFLAIGWLSLVGIIGYSILLIVLVVHFDYTLDFAIVTSGQMNMNSLSFFLVIKIITTTIILCGILYDTDIMLCLWYFGLMGCAVHYIRQYIKTKRIKYNGYPLVYAYAKIRFIILQFFKVVDVLCGVYGWYLLSRHFGIHWNALDSNIRLYYCFVILVLILTDIHISMLFLAQRWLLHRYKVLKAVDNSYAVSDDSEIEEFGLQVTAQDIEDEKQRLLEVEHESVMNILHYKELTKQDEVRQSNKVKIKGNKKVNKYNDVVPWNNGYFEQHPKSVERDLEEGISDDDEGRDCGALRDRGGERGVDSDDSSSSSGNDDDNDDDEQLKYLLAVSNYDHITFTAPPQEQPQPQQSIGSDNNPKSSKPSLQSLSLSSLVSSKSSSRYVVPVPTSTDTASSVNKVKRHKKHTKQHSVHPSSAVSSSIVGNDYSILPACTNNNASEEAADDMTAPLKLSDNSKNIGIMSSNSGGLSPLKPSNVAISSHTISSKRTKKKVVVDNSNDI